MDDFSVGKVSLCYDEEENAKCRLKQRTEKFSIR